jgi:hypothetical protein
MLVCRKGTYTQALLSFVGCSVSDGSGLDPDSIGSADPYPDWEWRSRSMEVEISPKKEKKKEILCKTSLNVFYRVLRRHMTVF